MSCALQFNPILHMGFLWYRKLSNQPTWAISQNVILWCRRIQNVGVFKMLAYSKCWLIQNVGLFKMWAYSKCELIQVAGLLIGTSFWMGLIQNLGVGHHIKPCGSSCSAKCYHCDKFGSKKCPKRSEKTEHEWWNKCVGRVHNTIPSM